MPNASFQKTFWRVGTAGLLAGGLLLGSLPQPARALPAPAVVYTFPAGSDPSALLVDTQQNLWVSLGSANALARLTSSFSETEVALSPQAGQPFDLALGPDGSVWFSQRTANQVGRYDEASGLPETFARATTPGGPTEVAAGQDGRLWFTEFSYNRLGWIRPDGETGLVPLPTPNSRPLGLALDDAGNLWFTEWEGDRLGKIDPQGSLSEVALPASPAHPAEIVLGPDQAMWFTYDNAPRVGRLDLASGTVSVYALSTASTALSDLTLGADGRIWFIGFQTVGSFAATPSGPDDLVEVPLDRPVFDSAGRSQIVQGPGNRLYFTKADSQNLYAFPMLSVDRRDLQVYVAEPPSQILANGPLETKVTVYNASQAQASDLSLQIGLPAEFALQAASPSAGDCQPDAAVLVCSLAALDGNQGWTVELSFAADQHAGSARQRLLTAQVSADQADYLPANNRLQRDLKLVNAITYATDFSAGADSHWSPGTVSRPDGSNAVLGPFANDTASLSFADLPPHDELTLCFDLYVLGGWDGDQADSQDRWAYSLDGQPVLTTTFSNRPGLDQSYPLEGSPAQRGAVQIGDFDGDGQANDARYALCAVHPHNAAGLQVSFSGLGLDAAEPERWALDNVRLQINYHAALYHQIFFLIFNGWPGV